MITTITILILAISNALIAYYSNKRADALQAEIRALSSELNNINVWASSFSKENNDAHINLDKQIKSQYSHFTSRIDKTRNDVLQNTRQY